MKRRILVFCDFYLPGFRSGGGMRTVVNLIDRFHDRFDLFVVTRNYDSPADKTPYTTVRAGEWNTVGNAKVYYLAAEEITTVKCAALTAEVTPDLVYLNSIFATTCVKFLMARAKLATLRAIPVVLAPCGELSRKALSLKPLKKRAYLAYSKARRLFDGVLWKASTDAETSEIRNVFGRDIDVMAAPDLAPTVILPDFTATLKTVKTPGEVRFVTLSRVVPIKNLRFILELLSEVDSGSVTLDIVGPLEDKKYWVECQKVIASLPRNIRVNATDAVSHETGLEHLISADFFVLPTFGENFGYVFIESLAAGTPLLISDRTMWSEVGENGCGWALPLEDRAVWIHALNKCIQMGPAEFETMSASARKFAVEWLASSVHEQATADVLERAMSMGAAKV